jgi:hypothetical protein
MMWFLPFKVIPGNHYQESLKSGITQLNAETKPPKSTHPTDHLPEFFDHLNYSVFTQEEHGAFDQAAEQIVPSWGWTRYVGPDSGRTRSPKRAAALSIKSFGRCPGAVGTRTFAWPWTDPKYAREQWTNLTKGQKGKKKYTHGIAEKTLETV